MVGKGKGGEMKGRGESLWLDFFFSPDSLEKHAGEKKKQRKKSEVCQSFFFSPFFHFRIFSMPAKPQKFYAVAAGRATGVFRSWDECQRSVHGFSGASFKAFTTSEEAEAFVVSRGGDAAASTSMKPLSSSSSSSKRARTSIAAAAAAGGAAAGGDSSDAPTEAASSKKKKPREEKKKKKEQANGTEATVTTTTATETTSTDPSSTPAAPSTSSFKQLADPRSLYALFFDGAARGNHVQGRGAVGGAGAVLYRVEEETEEESTKKKGSGGGTDADDTFSSDSSRLSEVGRLCVPLGTATNNAAEWAALELGLRASAATGVRRLRARIRHGEKRGNPESAQ